MNKRRVWLGLLAALIFAGAGSLLLPSVRRGLYRFLLDSGPGGARAWALEQLAEGPGGDAMLIEALCGEDPALAARAESALAERGAAAAPALIRQLERAPCRALVAKLGPSGAPALIAAIGAAKDGERRSLVVLLGELEASGDAAVLAAIDRGRDALRAGLADTDKDPRARLALMALRSLERAPGAKASLTFRARSSLEPLLIEALLVKAPETRLAAARALARISSPASLRLGFVKPGAAVPILVEAQRDPEAEVRAAAGSLLTRLTPRSLGLVAYFIQGLSDRNPNVRMAVARALVDLGPATSFPEPRLIEVLMGFEGDLAAEGLALVGRLGAKGKSALPRLRAMLEDPKPARRVAALEVLASLGTNARSEVDAVFGRLQDASPEVREAAANAAPLLLPSKAEVAALIAALRRRPDAINAEVARAFEGLGKRAVGALDLLERRFEQASGPLRADLIEALVAIGRGQPERLEPALLVALRGGGAPRKAALRGLVRLPLDGPELSAALDRISRGPDPEDRGLAIAALGARARESAAARRALVAAAEGQPACPEAWSALEGTAGTEETAGLIRRALGSEGRRGEALALLAGDSDQAGPHLSALLGLAAEGGAPDATRARAIVVIGRLGASAASAVPALIAAVEARDGQHRGLRERVASGALAAEPRAVLAALRQRQRVTAEAIRALGRIGAPASAAGAPLSAFLKSADDPSALMAALRERGASEEAIRVIGGALVQGRGYLESLAKEALVLVGKGEALRSQ